MKRLLVILMILVMIFVMTACGGSGNTGNAGNTGNESNAGNAEATANMIDVCIEIDYPDRAGMPDVEDYRFQIPEGSTALDMLHEFAKLYGIDVVMSDTSATPYVVSIGGVAENQSAGWVYEIDDAMTVESADQYIVKNRDEIQWEFMSWYDD